MLVNVFSKKKQLTSSILMRSLKIALFYKNMVLFYIIVKYYHFNIPTEGPFHCADTHMKIRTSKGPNTDP